MFKRAIILLLFTIPMVGCFKTAPQVRNLTSSSQLPDDSVYDLTPISFPIVGTPQSTVQVMDFRGVAPTYSALTGSTLTDLIRNGDPNLSNDLPTYSLDNQATSITATMLLNQTRLAAGFCLAAIKREMSGTRKFFTGFAFNTAFEKQNMDSLIRSAATTISQTFCNETPAQTTLDALVTAITNTTKDSTGAVVADRLDNNANNHLQVYGNNNYIGTGDAALITCTSFLASSCVLTNN